MSIEVTNDVWSNIHLTDLKPSHILVLLALADYADEHRRSWPSVQTLSRKTNLSQTSVRRILKKLNADGYIEIIRRKRPDGSFTSNVYVIKPSTAWHKKHPVPDDEGYYQNDSTPYQNDSTPLSQMTVPPITGDSTPLSQVIGHDPSIEPSIEPSSSSSIDPGPGIHDQGTAAHPYQPGIPGQSTYAPNIIAEPSFEEEEGNGYDESKKKVMPSKQKGENGTGVKMDLENRDTAGDSTHHKNSRRGSVPEPHPLDGIDTDTRDYNAYAPMLSPAARDVARKYEQLFGRPVTPHLAVKIERALQHWKSPDIQRALDRAHQAHAAKGIYDPWAYAIGILQREGRQLTSVPQAPQKPNGAAKATPQGQRRQEVKILIPNDPLFQV